MGKRSPTEAEYESDGGFVEDAPKSKKPKTVKQEAGRKAAPATAHGGTKEKDGISWEIARTRRIRINEFKGKTMVDIREYYEKDGETLPGKKGISLNIEQFNTVVGLLPQLEAALKEKGETVTRPDFSGAKDGEKKDQESEEEEEEEGSDNDDDE